jgi:hypothetical protein
MRLGVVTGCDGHHAWMIPWWLDRLKKHNPNIEVAFADFGGLSDAIQKKIYESVDVYIDLTGAKVDREWFKKPLAIYHCPFDKVIWMDSDCEVQGDISQMFNWCNDSHIGLTWDIGPGFNRGINGNTLKRAVASGVVVTHPKNELIREWCDMCLRARHIRGDQEVLNWMLDDRKHKKNITTKIKIMPKTFQWLRLEGYNPNALIMHWTGIDGKNHIAKQIDPKRHYNRTF